MTTKITEEINWELDRQIVDKRVSEDRYVDEEQYRKYVREAFARWLVKKFKEEKSDVI